jgi:hypothetical protein
MAYLLYNREGTYYLIIKFPAKLFHALVLSGYINIISRAEIN